MCGAPWEHLDHVKPPSVRPMQPLKGRSLAGRHVNANGFDGGMKHERRAAPITAAEVADHQHGGFIARVLRYGAPADDFGTTWERGVANVSLEKRMPVLAWGHSWAEPLGRATRWWEEGDGLYMEFAFDDPNDVPRARQARSQVQSGTLSDVSIGFVREKSEPNEDGTVNITRATIDEVSIVLRGAVSGAQVLSVRSGAVVPAATVAQLSAQLVSGEIDIADFLSAVKEASYAPAAPSPSDDEIPPPAEVSTDDIDAALELIGRSARR